MFNFKILDRVIQYSASNLYYSPPQYRLSVFNLLGLQILRFVSEKIRISVRSFFWRPHDRSMGSHIRKNGFAVFEEFLDQCTHKKLSDYLEAIVQRERSRPTSSLVSFKDEIALRLNIDEAYLYSSEGRLDSLAWKISRLLPHRTLTNLAEDVICAKDLTGIRFEIEYISVPEGGQDHYDHNCWWHADRHYHCGKAFYYVNDHDESNGTYEYIPIKEQSFFARLYYEYTSSVRSYLKYVAAGFNSTKMVELNILKPRVSNYEYKLLDMHPSPICAPQNNLIVSDNIGFHRRGKLSSGTKRVQVNFIFYKNRLSVTLYVLNNLCLFLKRVLIYIEKISSKISQVKDRGLPTLSNGIMFAGESNSRDERFSYMFNSGIVNNPEYKYFLDASKVSDVVFDVGANYGMFTFGIQPLSSDTEVHSFEPNKSLYNLLIETRRLNNISCRQCYINNFGVSNIDTVLPFHVNERWTGSSTFLADAAWRSDRVVDVNIVSLDSYIKNNDVDVTSKSILLKIDVEGLDFKVLLGAKSLLAACKEYFLIMELNGSQLVEDVGSFDFLESFYSRSAHQFGVASGCLYNIRSFDDLKNFLQIDHSEHIDLILASDGFSEVFKDAST